jgi:pantetheine-phosphate adenylyltransferase
MTLAMYPGSFDPITCGHEDLIRRSARVFDQLIIAVAHNPAKPSTVFSIDQRVCLIQQSVDAMNLTNVTVETFSGLTVRYARTRGVKCLIRGLRVVSDFEYECSMYQANAKLDPDINTVFMMPALDFQFLSSRVVRELASHHENLDHYVSPHVAQLLKLAYTKS